MTEFGLTLGMALLAIAIAAVLTRPQARSEPSARSLREASDTVRVAANNFTSIHARALFVLLLLVAFVLFVAYGFARPHHDADAASSAIETACWVAGSFALGALMVLSTLAVGVRSTLGGALQIAAATRSPSPLVLPMALRNSAAAGLLSTSFPLIGLIALSAGAWLRLSALGAQPAFDDLIKLPVLILAYGLGACVCALSARVVSGVFTSATGLCASLAQQPGGGLTADHPKNPAWLARQVATAIGHGAGSCVDAPASIAAACVASMVLGAALMRTNAPRLGAPLAVMLFGAMLITFGTFASMVGVLIVRSDARESPVRAFDRGLAATVVLSIAGHLACARWVFDTQWIAVSIASAAGLCAGVLGMGVSRWYAQPSSAISAQFERTCEAGPGAVTLAGASRGCERAAWMIAATAGPLALAYVAGSKSGLVGGGAFGIAVATAAMHAPAAFVGAVHGVTSIAAGSAILLKTQPVAGPEHQDRPHRLQEIAWAGKLGSGGLSSVWSAGVALAVAAALSELVHAAPKGSASAQTGCVGTFEMAVGTVIGVVTVFWFAARGLVAVWRAAEPAILDIRKHVRSGIRTEGSNLTFEENYDPEHQSCLSMLLQDSARQAIPVGLIALTIALGFEIIMQVVSARWGVVYAGEFVGAAVIAGSVAAVVLGFSLDGAVGVWSAIVRRQSTKFKTAVDDAEKRANNSDHGAAIVSDTVGGPLESMAAPSIQALIRVLVTVTVVLAPLFL